MGSVPKTTKHLLVDLDGTLYRSAKLFDDVRKNINGEIVSLDLAREYTNARGLCRAFANRETTGEAQKSDTPFPHPFPSPPPPPQPT